MELTVQLPNYNILVKLDQGARILARFDPPYIRIVQDGPCINYYRDTTLLARFCTDGTVSLKGILIRNVTLGSAFSNFQAFDEVTERIAYSLGGVRLMDIDTVTGDLLLAEREQLSIPATELGVGIPEGISSDGNEIIWAIGEDLATGKFQVVSKLLDDDDTLDLGVNVTVINNAF